MIREGGAVLRSQSCPHAPWGHTYLSGQFGGGPLQQSRQVSAPPSACALSSCVLDVVSIDSRARRVGLGHVDWKCLRGTSKPLLLPPHPEWGGSCHHLRQPAHLYCLWLFSSGAQDGVSVQGVQDMQVSVDSTLDLVGDLRSSPAALWASVSPPVRTLSAPLSPDHGNHTLRDSCPTPSVHSCVPPKTIY